MRHHCFETPQDVQCFGPDRVESHTASTLRGTLAAKACRRQHCPCTGPRCRDANSHFQELFVSRSSFSLRLLMPSQILHRTSLWMQVLLMAAPAKAQYGHQGHHGYDDDDLTGRAVEYYMMQQQVCSLCLLSPIDEVPMCTPCTSLTVCSCLFLRGTGKTLALLACPRVSFFSPTSQRI